MFMRCKVTVDTSHYPKEGPWELPKGWEWSTLGEVCSKVVDGDHNPPPSEPTPTEYLMISSKNVLDGHLDELKEVRYLSRSVFEECNKRTRLMRGDLLLTTVGTLGRSCIYDGNKKIVLQRSVSVLTPLVSSEYVKCFLDSGYFQRHIDNNARGTAQKGFYLNLLEATILPIPSLHEQRRIVAKTSSLLSELNRIDNENCELQDRISQAKSRILDLAIHGKLVPQNPSDEPAIELLKRIKPHFIPSDNLHYEGDLPNRWSIIRLGDVIDVISGTSYQKTDIVPTDSGIRILRGGNIQNGMIVLCEDDVFVNHRLSDKHLSLYRGDIALVASTGSRELIGKAAIAKRDYQNTQIGAFLRIIRPKATELSDYLGILFQSDYYKKHIQEAAKGTNINNIKTSYLTEFVVPLPPIKEQQRIIEKVNALFLILNYMADLSDC